MNNLIVSLVKVHALDCWGAMDNPNLKGRSFELRINRLKTDHYLLMPEFDEGIKQAREEYLKAKK